MNEKENILNKMLIEQETSVNNYHTYLELDIAKELSRINLPVSNYTEMYWKIDLHNLFHFLKLRMDPHAQEEIRVFADAMYNLIKPLFPIAIEAFEDYKLYASEVSRMEIDLISKIFEYAYLECEQILKDETGLSPRELKEFKTKFKIQ